jgi:hypothetical protein
MFVMFGCGAGFPPKTRVPRFLADLACRRGYQLRKPLVCG